MPARVSPHSWDVYSLETVGSREIDSIGQRRVPKGKLFEEPGEHNRGPTIGKN